MKKLLPFVLLLSLLLSGCAGNEDAPRSEAVSQSGETQISLSGGSAEIHGPGAEARNGLITIGAAGTYRVSGSLEGGSILVDTGDEPMEVTLILDGASVLNPDGAALHVKQAKNFRLFLENNTENLLRSGTEKWQPAPAEAEGAALYAEDDLDIEGSGSLTVEGYINNGIACKDDLDLNSGTVSVRAVNNGVRAKDSIQLKGGSLSVISLGDGLKTTDTQKEGKGNVEILGGTLTVGAWGDGIQAAADILITAGNTAVTAYGDGSQQSSKALKAAGKIAVSGGVTALYATEDAVRSDADFLLSGGTLNISTQGDGIQAGAKDSGLGGVDISGGRLGIWQCGKAVKVQQRLVIRGGSLLALCASEKQTAPDECALGYVLQPFPGRAGDQLRVNELNSGSDGLPAGGVYRLVFCADGSLVSGEMAELSNGVNTLRAPIR